MFKKIGLVALVCLGWAGVVQADTMYMAPAIGEVSAAHIGKERVVITNDRLVVLNQVGKVLSGFPVAPSTHTFAVTPVLADLNGDGLKEVIVIGHQAGGGDSVFVYSGNGTLLHSAVLGGQTASTVVYTPAVVLGSGSVESVLVSTNQGAIYNVALVSNQLMQTTVLSLAGAAQVAVNTAGTELYVSLPSSASVIIYGKNGSAWIQKGTVTLPSAPRFSAFDQVKNRWYGADTVGKLMAVDVKTKTMLSGWPVTVGVLAGSPVIADVNAANPGNEIVCVLQNGKRVVVSESGALLATPLASRSFINRGGDTVDSTGVFTWSDANFGQVLSGIKTIIGSYYSRINLPNIAYVAPPVVSNLVFGAPVYDQDSTMSVMAVATGSVAMASAEYYFVDKNGVESVRYPLNAADGTFDTNSEGLSGLVTINSWNADVAPYIVRVVVTDVLGNVSAPVSQEFTIVDQTDSDNTVTGFGGGTKTNVVWNTTKLMLDSTGLANGNGRYVSRVFDAGTATAWNTLAWKPLYPYGKPLPNGAQKEIAYTTGNVDMAGNVLLYHFDNNLTDSSGKNHNGTWAGNEQYATGVYDSAATFNSSYVNAGASDDFKIGKNITLEAWVNPSDSSSYKTILVRDGSYYLALNNLKPAVFLSGVSGQWQQATTALPLNAWSHVAVSYDGTTLKIFINGVLNRSIAISGTIATPPSKELWIGNRPESLPNYRYAGQIDEVAVFNRLLTPGEIFAHYRRGTFKAKFQVRTCQESSCADGVFAGPDGTSNSFYSEQNNLSVGLPSVALSNVGTKRYFQYQVFFETRLKTFGPELSSVVIGPGHIVTGEIVTPPAQALIDQTDDDNSASGFGGSTMTNVAWNAVRNSVELAGGQNGELISRVIDAGTSATWQTLTWKPLAPYGKELPGNGYKETVYTKNNVDMGANQLLVHFNEMAGATNFADSSGKNAVGVGSSTSTPIAGSVGIRNQAVQFDGVNDYLNFGAGTQFALAGPITMEAWVNPTGTGVYRTILTRNGSYYLALSNLKPAVYFEGLNKPGWHIASSSVPLNTWSHIVAVYDGATVKLYVNGVLDRTITGVSGSIATTANKELWVGGRAEPNYNFKGLMDEVAVYGRALDQTEVVARYQRQRTTLKFQVRVCATENCSDAVFVGPAGASSYFEDTGTGLPLITFNPVLTGRYIQYKAMLGSTGLGLTPELGSATFSSYHYVPE